MYTPKTRGYGFNDGGDDKRPGSGQTGPGGRKDEDNDQKGGNSSSDNSSR